MELFVGRSQHFALVDKIDAEGFEHLGFSEMTDAALGHHRDRDRLLDGADHSRIGHARHAAVSADIGGDALERHHGHRAGLLGDPGLLRGGDIHDHPALEHFGEADLDPHIL